MQNLKHSVVVFFLVYLGLFYLLGLMIWPFFSPVVFACILAGCFTPMMKAVNRKVKNVKWSAVIVCAFVILSIFIPFTFITVKLSQEALVLYKSIKTQFADKELEALLTNIDGYLPQVVSDVFKSLDIEINAGSLKNIIMDASKSFMGYVLETLNSWISNIFSFFFSFIIMLVVIFALLVDGPRIKKFFLNISPLPDEEEDLIIQKFNQINYVTLIGNGIGGVAQGVLGGVGLWLAGINSALLWTATMVVLAFIPLVGISIIYIPACVYLFIKGKTAAAVLLFIYCTLVSLVVENWFKPKFMGNKIQINSTLIFLSIVGGMSVFGIAGIFYGPIIISIFLTFVDFYHDRYA